MPARSCGPHSKKQLGYMWVHHPAIAHRWARRLRAGATTSYARKHPFKAARLPKYVKGSRAQKAARRQARQTARSRR